MFCKIQTHIFHFTCALYVCPHMIYKTIYLYKKKEKNKATKRLYQIHKVALREKMSSLLERTSICFSVSYVEIATGLLFYSPYPVIRMLFQASLAQPRSSSTPTVHIHFQSSECWHGRTSATLDGPTLSVFILLRSPGHLNADVAYHRGPSICVFLDNDCHAITHPDLIWIWPEFGFRSFGNGPVAWTSDCLHLIGVPGSGWSNPICKPEFLYHKVSTK